MGYIDNKDDDGDLDPFEDDSDDDFDAQDDDLGELDELDDLEAEDGEEESPRRRLLPIVAAIVALAGFGGVIWFAYDRATSPGDDDSAPLIRADSEPMKVKPDEPGGMEVPHQDKLVYEEIANSDPRAAPERLMPPAESPLPRPAPGAGLAPAPPTPVAQEDLTASMADTPAGPPPPPPPPTPPAAQAPPLPGAEIAQAPPPPPPPSLPPPSTATEAAGLEPPPLPPSAPRAPEPMAAPTPPKPEPEIAAPAAPPPPPPPSGAPVPAATVAASQPPPPPAEAEAPPPASAPPVTAAASAGGFVVQIAAVGSETGARSEWQRVQNEYGDLLGPLALDVQQISRDNRTFFRVRAAAFATQQEAKKLCDALKQRGQDCFATKR